MKKYQMINTATREVECEFTREEFEAEPARFTSEDEEAIDATLARTGADYFKSDSLDWLIENVYTGANCDRIIKEL